MRNRRRRSHKIACGNLQNTSFLELYSFEFHHAFQIKAFSIMLFCQELTAASRQLYRSSCRWACSLECGGKQLTLCSLECHEKHAKVQQ